MLARYAEAHPAPPPSAAPRPPAETAMPAPKRVWTSAEIYPDPHPGTEDGIDCRVALALAWGYAEGEASDRYLQAFLATDASLTAGTDLFEARSNHLNDKLGKDGATAMADRCLASANGAAVDINPQREQLMGAMRYALYLSNAASAARAEDEARAREVAERNLRDLYARCDAAASAGLDRAGDNMAEAQRMALNWAATGRYGTNYAVEPFNRGCGNVRDTWATMNNMQCPDKFFNEIQSFFDQYVLDLGTGALYCEQLRAQGSVPVVRTVGNIVDHFPGRVSHAFGCIAQFRAGHAHQAVHSLAGRFERPVDQPEDHHDGEEQHE